MGECVPPRCARHWHRGASVRSRGVSNTCARQHGHRLPHIRPPKRDHRLGLWPQRPRRRRRADPRGQARDPTPRILYGVDVQVEHGQLHLGLERPGLQPASLHLHPPRAVTPTARGQPTLRRILEVCRFRLARTSSFWLTLTSAPRCGGVERGANRANQLVEFAPRQALGEATTHAASELLHTAGRRAARAAHWMR